MTLPHYLIVPKILTLSAFLVNVFPKSGTVLLLYFELYLYYPEPRAVVQKPVDYYHVSRSGRTSSSRRCSFDNCCITPEKTTPTMYVPGPAVYVHNKLEKGLFSSIMLNYSLARSRKQPTQRERKGNTVFYKPKQNCQNAQGHKRPK